MKIRNLFNRKKSREIAKDRLKILLISDRVNCSPEMMEMIKTDIAKVISKYMKIDAKSMEIQTQEARNKNMMEQKFNSIHKQVKEIRQSQKVVNQYYRNMMKNAYTDPQFLDNKK